MYNIFLLMRVGDGGGGAGRVKTSFHSEKTELKNNALKQRSLDPQTTPRTLSTFGVRLV